MSDNTIVAVEIRQQKRRPKKTVGKVKMMRRALVINITEQATYRPGDLPPMGYLAWHEWADVQRKAGIKQVFCNGCGKWKTPQETKICRKRPCAAAIRARG